MFPVSLDVKRSLLLVSSLLVCSSAFAADVEPKLDRAVKAALPVCAGAKITYGELGAKLPPRFTGRTVRVEGGHCESQHSAILSPAGGFYLGHPWPIESAEGATIEAKLKNFIWQNLQMNVTPVIDREKPNEDGLYAVTLQQATENGKMPLAGSVDPNGKVFFFGTFRRFNGEIAPQRTKAFEPFFASMPARGPASAPVTIVEFSDFECPSCKRTSGIADTILAKHGDKVRYIRFDLPLTGHPWAFPASLAGRAIYRQKPELFWEYKKQVYANQDTLTAFMFWDWARAFAQDRELDMKRYDADLADEAIKAEILKGAGAAFSNDIRATPSYMVNGVLVDYGDEGKDLLAYVDAQLK